MKQQRLRFRVLAFVVIGLLVLAAGAGGMSVVCLAVAWPLGLGRELRDLRPRERKFHPPAEKSGQPAQNRV